MEGSWLGMVKVVSRVRKPLTITFDGKSITVPALGSIMVPPIVADKGLQQNPVMGTEDPYNARVFESMLGVEGWPNAPCSPLDKDAEAKAEQKEERIDRSLLPPEAQKATRLRSSRERPAPMPGVVDGGDVHFDGR